MDRLANAHELEAQRESRSDGIAVQALFEILRSLELFDQAQVRDHSQPG